MDFTNRSAQPAHHASANGGASVTAAGGGKKNSGWHGTPMWLKATWIVLLFSGTIIAVSLVILFYFGGSKESNRIDKDRSQAVFLTNGQVYFGDIKEIKGSYLELKNIYYLSVNQAVQPSDASKQQQTNISLIKLGCELHGPVDQMIINREQITFWENLKDDGKVAKAMQEWREQNPDGQKCNASTTTDTTKKSD